MIGAIEWQIRCDEPGCEDSMTNRNYFRLRDDGRAAGWQFNVKLNGEQAKRGGKDYCRQHRKGE